MNDQTTPSGRQEYQVLLEGMESIKRHLRRLIVSVSLMMLALILTVAAVFGNLVNYFAGQVALWGGALAGAAILGFVIGWFAHRKV